MRRARLYCDLGNGVVQCEVCERRCTLRPGARGICGNYVNIEGVLYHLGYGKLSAVESRPIEVKPFFHYWPNSTALTFSNWGCNFYCPWCQNYHISFARPPENAEVTPPSSLVRAALSAGDEGLCASFNEPTTNFDYLLDVFLEGQKLGLYATMVTNGYQTLKAVEELIAAGVDGWSIDIKGYPGMKLLKHIDHAVIYRNARRILDLGGHVEMVYLVVTGVNDSDECAKWIIGQHLDLLGPSVPLHVNRYYPAHAWRKPPTPVSRLLEIADLARREGIEYVYVGNLADPKLESTYCPGCGKLLIYRQWHRVLAFNLDFDEGRYRCPRCGKIIPIRGKYIPGK